MNGNTVNIDTKAVERLETLVRDAGKVSIVAHIRPDGDAVGSTLAMLHYLLSRGKDAVVIYSDPLPETLTFMLSGTPEENVLQWPSDSDSARERIAETNLIFCLDCNSFTRTGDLEPMLRAARCRKVLIDHHLAPEAESFDVVFSETAVSSACELLFNVLMSMPDIHADASLVPAVSATSLMTGMTTDTNNFANSVYPSTLTMASALLGVGVDRDAILSNLYQSGTEKRVRLWGYMLYQNMKLTDYGVAYMILTEEIASEFNISEGETEGLVNEPLRIASVKMSIFLKQDDAGFFRVSIRSKKGFSAVGCSKAYFHGGGHENASGGRLFFKANDGNPADISSPSQAEKYLLKVTSEYFKSGDYESR